MEIFDMLLSCASMVDNTEQASKFIFYPTIQPEPSSVTKNLVLIFSVNMSKSIFSYR